MPNPIPPGFSAVTPYLIVDDGKKEIDFLVQGLGGVEDGRLEGPDGSIMHSVVKVGGAPIMLSGAGPQMAAIHAMLFIYVADVDSAFAKAAAFPGVAVEMPVADQFWGDRCGSLKSPNGITYWIGTNKEVLTHEEIGRRAGLTK